MIMQKYMFSYFKFGDLGLRRDVVNENLDCQFFSLKHVIFMLKEDHPYLNEHPYINPGPMKIQNDHLFRNCYYYSVSFVGCIFCISAIESIKEWIVGPDVPNPLDPPHKSTTFCRSDLRYSLMCTLIVMFVFIEMSTWQWTGGQGEGISQVHKKIHNFLINYSFFVSFTTGQYLLLIWINMKLTMMAEVMGVESGRWRSTETWEYSGNFMNYMTDHILTLSQRVSTW